LKKTTFLTLLAGLCLLLPSYFGSESQVFLLNPSPFLPGIFHATCEWLLDYRRVETESATVMLPMLLFLVWNPGLLRGQLKIPRRTYLLLAAVIALSFVYLVGSWNYGVQYQGVGYTFVVDAINLGWIAILCFLSFRNWKGEPYFLTNLAVHWIFFAWIAWYAFPWLGEPI
jgi:hypothetical protein